MSHEPPQKLVASNPEQEITIFRVRSEQIGYGRLGVYLADEIEKQGITVYDEIRDAEQNFVLDSPEAYKAFGPKAPEAGISEVVLWVSVPSHARGWWSGQKAVLFTMWETSHLPTSFRENFHEFDTLIVPSEQNLELFSRYHDNVKYVPLGVDTERWHYVPRKMPTTRFNFLVSGRGLRKGTDLVYKAFREVFPAGSWPEDMPTPYLIMKSPRPEDYFGERIENINGYIPSEAEVDLYANAHCYLGASRGEGFGLQPLQAIAQGLPTILTDAHGHKSFSHLGMPLDAELDKAGYFVFGDAGAWWEPDYKQLCEYMEYVYYNYAECVERAKVNAAEAAKFNWTNCANGVLDAIGRDRLRPCPDPGHWHEPQGKLYKIVLVRDHVFDIGGYVRKLEKGVEYRVPADTKRILFDAGLVDVERSASPAADMEGGHVVWDAGDDGLLPEQVAKIPELTKRQSYCPTCHQKYGTGESLTDLVLAEGWTR
jgi:glycosyltransferase involved in cell wall biosynthesis